MACHRRPTASTAPTRCWPTSTRASPTATTAAARGSPWARIARAHSGVVHIAAAAVAGGGGPAGAQRRRPRHDVFGRKRGALPAAISASVDPLRCQTILVRELLAALNARVLIASSLSGASSCARGRSPGRRRLRQFRHRGNASFAIEAMRAAAPPHSDGWSSRGRRPTRRSRSRNKVRARARRWPGKGRRDEQHRMYEALEREGLEHAARSRGGRATARLTRRSRWLGADGGGDAPSADLASGRRAEATRPPLRERRGRAYPGADPERRRATPRRSSSGGGSRGAGAAASRQLAIPAGPGVGRRLLRARRGGATR